MKTYQIGVIAGDGTGPEVIREGRKVLDVAAKKFGIKLNYVDYDLGGERYKKTGEILPDSVVPELKKLDAIYLGAIGHPDVKPGILEKGLLLRIRFELDQYKNLRPVRLYRTEDCPIKDKTPKDIDYCVIRENSGGLYTGIGGISRKGTKDEVAQQEGQRRRHDDDGQQIGEHGDVERDGAAARAEVENCRRCRSLPRDRSRRSCGPRHRPASSWWSCR